MVFATELRYGKSVPNLALVDAAIAEMAASPQPALWFSDPSTRDKLSYEALIMWSLELPLTMPGDAAEIQKVFSAIQLVAKFDLLQFLQQGKIMPKILHIWNRNWNLRAWSETVPERLFNQLQTLHGEMMMTTYQFHQQGMQLPNIQTVNFGQVDQAATSGQVDQALKHQDAASLRQALKSLFA